MSVLDSTRQTISLLRENAAKFFERGTQDLRSAKITEVGLIRKTKDSVTDSVDITFESGVTIRATRKISARAVALTEEILNRRVADYAKVMAERGSNTFKLACLRHLVPFIGSLPADSKREIAPTPENKPVGGGNSEVSPDDSIGRKTELYFEIANGATLLNGTVRMPRSERIKMLSELSMGVAALHDTGIIHRDIAPRNAIVEPGINLVKLIDLGRALSYATPFEFDYDPVYLDYAEFGDTCSPIELQKFLEKKYVQDIRRGRFAKNLDQANERLRSIMQPSYDIYSIGLSILPILFGKYGDGKIFAYFYKMSHEKAKGGSMRWPFLAIIDEHKRFFKDAMKNVKACNGRLSEKQRYTPEQCTFIAKAIRTCMDPIPKNRPSAAQVAEIFELFAGGMTDFDEAIELAREDRPTEYPNG